MALNYILVIMNVFDWLRLQYERVPGMCCNPGYHVTFGLPTKTSQLGYGLLGTVVAVQCLQLYIDLCSLN